MSDPLAESRLARLVKYDERRRIEGQARDRFAAGVQEGREMPLAQGVGCASVAAFVGAWLGGALGLLLGGDDRSVLSGIGIGAGGLALWVASLTAAGDSG